MNDKEKIEKALELIYTYSQIDGAHHKAWVIDQVTRILLEDKYESFIKDYKKDDDGNDAYSWDEGITP